MKDSYIKFNCDWDKSELLFDVKELNKWRDKLYSLKLIGAHPDGVGYGNISQRNGKNFIITGSKTGGIEKLTLEHYTRVEDWNFEKNYLHCDGPIEASSESLTHAAVYESLTDVNAVIHIHNLELWSKLINKVPTTSKNVEYGTPKMAYEIKRLIKNENIEKKIIVMAGHEEGIITFGKNLDEAGKILLDIL